MKISILIPSKEDRIEIIRNILLPSLEKQTYRNFEVIFVYFGDIPKLREIVNKTLIKNKVKIIKANKLSAVSQRNQGIRYCQGEIIFFSDDDIEFFPKCMEFVKNEFTQNTKMWGLGLDPFNYTPKDNVICVVKDLLKFIYNQIFMLGFYNYFDLKRKRKVLPSGWNISGRGEGEAEWLSGCSMAFRKEIFEKYSFKFNEKLEKFGGWTYTEDVELSHKIWRWLKRNKKGNLFLYSKKKFVIHHEAKGKRLSVKNKYAAYIYNRFIVVKESISNYTYYRMFPYLTFFWSLIGFIPILLFKIVFKEKQKIEALKGIISGIKEVINEIY